MLTTSFANKYIVNCILSAIYSELPEEKTYLKERKDKSNGEV